MVSISNDKRQLKDLEDKILKLLKESTGNILDDEQLINTLNHSKTTSGVIGVSGSSKARRSRARRPGENDGMGLGSSLSLSSVITAKSMCAHSHCPSPRP